MFEKCESALWSSSFADLSDEPRQGVGVSAEAEILADAQPRAGVNEDDMTENPEILTMPSRNARSKEVSVNLPLHMGARYLG